MPIIVKRELTSLKSSGSVIGNLYALSSLGSILGVFCGGLLILPALGKVKSILVLAVILALIGTLTYRLKKILLAYLVLILGIILLLFKSFNFLGAAIDRDSAYNRIFIYDSYFDKDKVRIMQINDEFSSAMFLEKKDLLQHIPIILG